MKKCLTQKQGPISKAKSCCKKHPILTAIVAVIIVAMITSAILEIVKAVRKRDDDLIDDIWDLDDDDDEDLYLYTNEEAFSKGFSEGFSEKE